MPKNRSEIRTLTVGSMKENCYFVIDTASNEMIIIDPGDDAQYLAEKILQSEATPKAIFLTHGHFDHMMAAGELQKTFSVPVYLHEEDEFLVSRVRETAEHFLGHDVAILKPELTVFSGAVNTFKAGSVRITSTHLPGHTPGGVMYACADLSVRFVGDTVFAGGSTGRYDFSYSDRDLLFSSVRTVMKLPEETVLYCGHGDTTTVGEEKVYYIHI